MGRGSSPLCCTVHFPLSEAFQFADSGVTSVVPLGPFHVGFLLAVGILSDVFIVRALPVPSLITLVGPLSSWPSGILPRERRTRVGKDRANA